MPQLVLLRHGQSQWNADNLFTGWYDVDLTAQGEDEARQSGRLLADQAELDLRVLHTSLLTGPSAPPTWPWRWPGGPGCRSVATGASTSATTGPSRGSNKKETTARHGEAQVKEWRRSYDTPPPPVEPGSEHDPAGDPRYRDVPAELLPASECLADVVDRVLPYWYDAIVPDLLAEGPRGGAVLVVAHGNSLRALRKHIDAIGDDEIVGLDIPTGIPFLYHLADDLSVVSGDYLGDPAAAGRRPRRSAARPARAAPAPAGIPTG